MAPWQRKLLFSSGLLMSLGLAPQVVPAAEVVVTQRPSNLGRTENKHANKCLRHSSGNNLPAQFIINFCKKVVYLSVVEYDIISGAKYCAVYGLQGGKYGKKYGPGEMYVRASVKASYKADRALDYCKYSGYELTGQGIGEFVHFVKNSKKRDKNSDPD